MTINHTGSAMKVSAQSSLIAAQALGVQRSSTDAKAASAAFFAELKKSAPAASAAAPAAATAPEAMAAAGANGKVLRTAAPGAAQGAAALPPGSLLNIVV